MTGDEVLGRLRSLGACDEAVRPVDDPKGPGWVVAYLDDGATMEDLWRVAVETRIVDAWWLAGRLGVATPAVDACLRRALRCAATACAAAGIDARWLVEVADAESLDLEAADAAARVAAGAAAAADAAGGPGAAARAVMASEDAARVARTAWAAEYAARVAARAAVRVARTAWDAVERAQQRADLLALWPEVERAFRAWEVSDEA